MPYMFGVANRIKKSKFVSSLRHISTKGGKKRRLHVSSDKIPTVTNKKSKDYSIQYLSTAIVLVIILSVVLVPVYNIGGIILPAVLVPTFFFIIAAFKSLFE